MSFFKSFDLVSFIVTFISQFVLIYAFLKLSKKNLNSSKLFGIIMVLSSLFESIASRFLPVPLNVCFCIIYFMIIFKFFIKANYKEVIFYMLIIWLISYILDMILMLILNIINNYFYNLNYNQEFIKSICSIIQCGLLLIILRISFVNKVINKLYSYFNKITYKSTYLIILLFLYGLIDTISLLNWENKIMLPILVIISLLFTLTIIKFTIYRYEIITLKETNDLLISKNEFYDKLLNDYRILKHNLTSQLLGIKTVSNKKSKALIDDLIKDYNATFQTTQDFRDIPIGLNGLVYEKFYNFNNKELIVYVENKLKNKVLDYITPRSYNLLCEALGVTLDNALESSASSKEKIVYLKFWEDKNFLSVSIANTFSGTLELDKIGTINYTTKKIGNGLGLYSLYGRKNLQIKTTIKNNLFVNLITITKNKKL